MRWSHVLLAGISEAARPRTTAVPHGKGEVRHKGDNSSPVITHWMMEPRCKFRSSVSCLVMFPHLQSYSLSTGNALIGIYFLKIRCRASLVAQWLRLCLLMQGTRVGALVWEDPTCRGAIGPVSHNCWACASGACAPQRERPRWGGAHAPRWGVAPACRGWGKP